MGLRGSLGLTDALVISISAENLLDTDYSITDGYRAPGRTLGISLEYMGE